MVCGATTAYRLAALIPRLAALGRPVITLPTPHSERVVSGRELARIDGHRLVHSYFDDAMLPRPEPGLILVAPCTFNSLRKLALGLADNFPLSVVTEGIGQGWPVVLAPSLSTGLWRHPLRAAALAPLGAWGVHIVPPDAASDYAMAPDDQIVEAVAPLLVDPSSG